MRVQGLDHYTVNVRDVDRSIAFYDAVLGFKPGFRPDLGFPGAWLYCGQQAVVHLVAGRPADGEHNGAFDHVALQAADFDGMCRHLETQKVPYRTQGVPGGRRQIFIHDPDGVKIELNYAG
jgi:catechol 2,3-dioxygenase-like lactoylglutathione lyase family enzyme